MIPEVKDKWLILVTLEDGCRFSMTPEEDEPAGWQLNLPGGFEVTCPHGYKESVLTVGGTP